MFNYIKLYRRARRAELRVKTLEQTLLLYDDKNAILNAKVAALQGDYNMLYQTSHNLQEMLRTRIRKDMKTIESLRADFENKCDQYATLVAKYIELGGNADEC